MEEKLKMEELLLEELERYCRFNCEYYKKKHTVLIDVDAGEFGKLDFEERVDPCDFCQSKNFIKEIDYNLFNKPLIHKNK